MAKAEDLSLLLVEDEPAHAEAVRRSLAASDMNMEVRAVGTLREYRKAVAARPPDIALLDLVLPDGRALEALTCPPEDAPFPIVVMTSFGNEQTAVAAMKAGAIDYLVKSPETFAQISHTISRALRAWNGLQERRRAEERLNETLQRLRQAVTSTIRVLGLTVEARDPYTAGHQQRTTKLAVAIAEEMGLPAEKIDGLRLAGEIHDLGKISMPSEILSKPSRLTPFEFDLVKTHPRKGYGILKDVELPWPVAEIVYQHHERIDGSGYPRGFQGTEIILEARILAVADTVEAMASHRPYRGAPGIDAALREIEKGKGVIYDDEVASACLRVIREKGFAFDDPAPVKA